jgi:hypothetical protein
MICGRQGFASALDPPATNIADKITISVGSFVKKLRTIESDFLTDPRTYLYKTNMVFRLSL